MEAKVDMRKKLKQMRDNLSEEEVMRRSSAIFTKLFSTEEFIQAECVMFYMSFRNEVHTHKMVERSLQIGKRVVLPRVNLMNEEVEIYEVTNLSNQLSKGILGILEPDPSLTKKANISEIDICLVPGIVFDKYGNRLGWGKGYYDRFLRRLDRRTMKIGLAYDFQVVNYIEPEDEGVFVDKVITEEKALVFANR